MKTLLLLYFCFLPALLFAQEQNLQPGGYYIGQVEPGVRPFYGDRPLEVSTDGHFLLGFGRDATLEQQIALVDASGRESLLRLKLAPRQYKIERINGISRKMMQPTQTDLARINQEARQVDAAREVLSLLDGYRQPFIWPLRGRISGVYGSQRILNGEPRRPHFGVDISAPKGTPVVAPATGIVRLAHPGMFFSGKTLILDHGFGLTTSYLHLSEIFVRDGQRVEQGEEVARVGASGRVTGPHLDWRMNWFDARIDPQLWVEPMPQ